MNFIEFCISRGYKAYRKVYNPSSKKWGYIEAFDTTYFSSSSPGYIDIRLIKDGAREIVYGIPGVYTSKGGDSNKTHFPTLIYPNPFGEINEVDRAFGELTFEEILDEIEKLS